jgi:hypothetical protein
MIWKIWKKGKSNSEKICFTLEITNKWWPLTTLNRWLLYQIKIYSKMHRESTKVTVMSRWPLYKGLTQWFQKRRFLSLRWWIPNNGLGRVS